MPRLLPCSKRVAGWRIPPFAENEGLGDAKVVFREVRMLPCSIERSGAAVGTPAHIRRRQRAACLPYPVPSFVRWRTDDAVGFAQDAKRRDAEPRTFRKFPSAVLPLVWCSDGSTGRVRRGVPSNAAAAAEFSAAAVPVDHDRWETS